MLIMVVLVVPEQASAACADGSGTDILITGGTVNATCLNYGAAIGGSYNSDNVSVTISGGTVEADGVICWYRQW